MRRRPVDQPQNEDTRVFSNGDWENEEFKYISHEDTLDLASYAAVEIPEGRQYGARVSRYSPSPHSSRYEVTGNETNSLDDPFTRAGVDHRQTLFAANRHVEEMPSPTRKSKVGGSTSEVADSVVHADPQHDAPQLDSARTSNPHDLPSTPQMFSAFSPPAPEARVEYVLPDAPLAPPTVEGESEHRTDTHSEPVDISPQEYAPLVAHIDPIETDVNPEAIEGIDIFDHVENAPLVDKDSVEEDEELSDFEEEFLVAQESAVDIDLTEPEAEIVASTISSDWDSPVSSGFENIRHTLPVDLFAPRQESETNEDDFYEETRDPGQTIQIDMAFISRQCKRLLRNKIALAVVIVVALAFGALLVFTTGSDEAPTSGTSTKVVSSNSDSGSLVSYDINGNPVYSNE